MFGNFDPNKFNSQAGQSFNPNAFSGGSGSTSSGGMSMFNPNAMMGGGSGSGKTMSRSISHMSAQRRLRSVCPSHLHVVDSSI